MDGIHCFCAYMCVIPKEKPIGFSALNLCGLNESSSTCRQFTYLAYCGVALFCICTIRTNTQARTRMLWYRERDKSESVLCPRNVSHHDM